MDKEQLITLLNKLRKNTPKNWVFWNGDYVGGKVRYKSFGTWVQVLEITRNGSFTRDSSVMGLSVSGFKDFLNDAL